METEAQPMQRSENRLPYGVVAERIATMLKEREELLEESYPGEFKDSLLELMASDQWSGFTYGQSANLATIALDVMALRQAVTLFTNLNLAYKENL